MEYSPLEQEIYSLREEVSRTKRDFGVEYALPSLRLLYSKMLEHGGYGVGELLRLPLHLQQANKFEEALEIMDDLAIKFSDPYSISAIADKRRLMLQREKRYLEAVTDGITSYLFNLLGLHKSATQNSESVKDTVSDDEYTLIVRTHFANNVQYCLEQIRTMQSEDYIKDMLLKLLKKAKRTDLLDELTQLILHQIKDLSNLGVILFEKQLRQVIET